MIDSGIPYTITTPRGTLELNADYASDGLFLRSIDVSKDTDIDIAGRGFADGSIYSETRLPGLRRGLQVLVHAGSPSVRDLLESQLMGYVDSLRRATGSITWTAKGEYSRWWEDYVSSLSPLSWWRLNETSGTVVADAIGAFPLTNNSPAHITLNHEGAISTDADTSYYFDGFNPGQYLTRAYDVALNPTACTYTCFFKLDAGTNNSQVLFHTRTGTPTFTGVSLEVSLQTDDITLYWGTGSSTGSVGASLGVLTPDVWHMSTFTFDGTYFRLYFDGALVATSSSTTYVPTTTLPLLVGGNGGSNPLKGYLDEVMVFNRALTTDDVTAVYDAYQNPEDSSTRVIQDVRAVTVPRPSGYVGQSKLFDFEIIAPRSYVEGAIITQDSSALVPGGGGLIFPTPTPWVFGGTSGGVLNVINLGYVDEYGTYTIYGPITNPVLTRTDTQQALYLDGLSIPAGDTITIDMFAKSIVINGAQNARSFLRPVDSSFFAIPPGGAEVQLTGSNTDANTKLRAQPRGAFPA